MPAPETDWVDGIIPPARYWRVVHRYIGVSSGRIFDDPDACFTSDAICRRIYSRFPTDRDGNYQPITVPQPADPADLCLCYPCDLDAPTNGDDDHVPGAIDGGDDDAGRGKVAQELPGDNADTGGGDHLLLGSEDPHAHPNPDVQDVQHSSAGRVLQEGELT